MRVNATRKNEKCSPNHTNCLSFSPPSCIPRSLLYSLLVTLCLSHSLTLVTLRPLSLSTPVFTKSLSLSTTSPPLPSLTFRSFLHPLSTYSLSPLPPEYFLHSLLHSPTPFLHSISTPSITYSLHTPYVPGLVESPAIRLIQGPPDQTADSMLLLHLI